MKRCKKNLASRTVLAAVQFCLTMALAACAAAIQVSAPSSDQAPGSTSAIPPGQRLEQFSLCYELRRPMASSVEKPVKRFSIDVSILVPEDDCLALDANGWLSVVPGQCTRMPAKSTCEEKP
jgi:hypothetical protein